MSNSNTSQWTSYSAEDYQNNTFLLNLEILQGGDYIIKVKINCTFNEVSQRESDIIPIRSSHNIGYVSIFMNMHIIHNIKTYQIIQYYKMLIYKFKILSYSLR